MPRVDRYGGPWRDPAGADRRDDPWQGLAPYSAQPLSAWRSSLVAEFLHPYLGANVTALELGPGIGDWTAQVIDSVQTMIVADRRVETVEGIRQRFGPRPDLREVQVIDDQLVGIADGSVDIAYSLDFFPFVEWSLLESLLEELGRVLRPGGHLVIHHAATPRRLRTVIPRRTGLSAIRTSDIGRPAAGRAAGQAQTGSASSFTANGLVTTRQTSAWGPAGEFTVDKYRDLITVARKPGAAELG